MLFHAFVSGCGRPTVLASTVSITTTGLPSASVGAISGSSASTTTTRVGVTDTDSFKALRGLTTNGVLRVGQVAAAAHGPTRVLRNVVGGELVNVSPPSAMLVNS